MLVYIYNYNYYVAFAIFHVFKTKDDLVLLTFVQMWVRNKIAEIIFA